MNEAGFHLKDPRKTKKKPKQEYVICLSVQVHSRTGDIRVSVVLLTGDSDVVPLRHTLLLSNTTP